MNKAEQAAAALFVWGALTTTEPPTPLDQQIVREVRAALHFPAVAFPVARPGDNRGFR